MVKQLKSKGPSVIRPFIDGVWERHYDAKAGAFTTWTPGAVECEETRTGEPPMKRLNTHSGSPASTVALRELLLSFTPEEVEIARALRGCLVSGARNIEAATSTGHASGADSMADDGKRSWLEGTTNGVTIADEREIHQLGSLVLQSIGSFTARGQTRALKKDCTDHSSEGRDFKIVNNNSIPPSLLDKLAPRPNESSSIGDAKIVLKMEAMAEQHKTSSFLPDLCILPMFASLPLPEQQRVFEPASPNCRKVIFATNVAETSVTVPGVRYVVDCGLYKTRAYNPRSGVEMLKTRRISRAMANQRTGRAGREAPGESYRLYSEQDYYRMDIQADPEIKRCNLAEVVLELKAIGVKDVSSFPFISTPSAASLEKAEQLLLRIGALDHQKGITKLGYRLAALPISPEFGKFLLDSVKFDCTAEALTIVSVLNSDSIFFQTSKHEREESRKDNSSLLVQSGSRGGALKGVSTVELARKQIVCVFGDHLTILNAYRMWESAESPLEFCKSVGLNHRSLLKAKNIRTQLKVRERVNS